MTDKIKMRKKFDFLTTLILTMLIQKVIHMHIPSQQKRMEFSGIHHCFFIRLCKEDTFISVQK